MSFLIGRIGPGVSNLLSLIRRVSNLLRLSDHFYFAERPQEWSYTTVEACALAKAHSVFYII